MNLNQAHFFVLRKVSRGKSFPALTCRCRLTAAFTGVTIIVWLMGFARALSVAGVLEDLTRPHEGRSMRATSSMRVGEVRRGWATTKPRTGARSQTSTTERGRRRKRAKTDSLSVPLLITANIVTSTQKMIDNNESGVNITLLT